MTDAGATRILLVEDSTADAVLLRAELGRSPLGPFAVAHVTRLADALTALRKRPFDAILVDLGLPDSQGLGTLGKLTEHNARGVPGVVLAGLAVLPALLIELARLALYRRQP
jgi:DNA-binding response OmpR family regulator